MTAQNAAPRTSAETDLVSGVPAGGEARLCDQCRTAPATGYAIDPRPGGWGGHYCASCTTALRFQVVDRYPS